VTFDFSSGFCRSCKKQKKIIRSLGDCDKYSAYGCIRCIPCRDLGSMIGSQRDLPEADFFGARNCRINDPSSLFLTRSTRAKRSKFHLFAVFADGWRPGKKTLSAGFTYVHLNEHLTSALNRLITCHRKTPANRCRQQ
jgi:hypothetical protein